MAGNQYKADPRQSLFLSYYLDTQSETFSNALQSALRAGYEKEYAENITSLMPDWLSEAIGDMNLIKKAEKNLLYFLTDTKDERIKADITKFVSERLNKRKYSSRQEHTGKNGKDLVPTITVMTTEAKDNLNKLYEDKEE